MKLRKSVLALAVSACFGFGLFFAASPVMVLAEEETLPEIGTVDLIDTITDGGSSYRDINNFCVRAGSTNHMEPQIDGRADTHRMVFLTYDLADYLENPNAVINSVQLQFYFRGIPDSAASGGSQGQGTGGIPGGTAQDEDSPFGFYIMRQGSEPKDLPAGTALHYANIRNSGVRLIDNGIGDDPGARLASWRPLNPTSTHVVGAGGGDRQYSGELWDAIQEHLAETGGTQFTLRISLPKGYSPNCAVTLNSRYRANMGTALMEERPLLRVDYTEDLAIGALKAAAGLVTAETIAPGQDLKNVTGNLNLPAELENGVKIDWTSSDAATVSETGIVTRPPYGEGNRPVTLEALFSSGEFTVKKSFDLTVLSRKENPDGEPGRMLCALEAGYVSGGSGASTMASFGDQQLRGRTAEDGAWASFVKFDFADRKQTLSATDSILLRLVPFNWLPLGSAGASENLNGAASSVKISLIEADDNWNTSLTYDAASGMLAGGTELHTSTGMLDGNGYYTGNILNEIKSYCNENPTKNTVTLRIEATDGTFAFHGLGAGGDDLKPALVITSAQSAVNAAEAYLTFDKISEENSTQLRGDLDFSKLDAGLAGLGLFNTSIVWSVADGADDVIDLATGVVTRKAQDAAVMLRAAITSGSVSITKDFPITVLGYESDSAYYQTLLSSIAFDTTVITGSFPIPEKLELMDVIWTSDDPEIIKPDNRSGLATVGRPRSKDLYVNLTATVSDGRTTESKTFPFFVLRRAANDVLANKALLNASGNQENAVDDDTTTMWTVGTDGVLTINIGNTAKAISEFLLVYEGSPVSDVVIQTSEDSYVWNTVFTGSVQPKTANYIKPLNAPVFSKFVRLELPQGVDAVRTFGGYLSQAGSGVEESVENTLKNLVIPRNVTNDFALPETAGDFAIGWTSNDSAVRIDGSTARVTRETSDRDAILTASVTVDQTPLRWNYTITVAGTGSGGSSSGGGGRKSSSSYSAPNVPAATAPPAIEPPVEVFADLDDARWAEPYIVSLNSRGIIVGYPDGTFVPNGSLKREEMAKLLAEGFDLSGEGSVQFDDVRPGDWYYDYVNKLLAGGVTNGIGERMFGAGQNISRQDAAAMLARLLAARGIHVEAGDTLPFNDDADIADYAKDGVYVLQALGIIGGDEEGKFKPEADITRAEMSKIIYLSSERIG